VTHGQATIESFVPGRRWRGATWRTSRGTDEESNDALMRLRRAPRKACTNSDDLRVMYEPRLRQGDTRLVSDFIPAFMRWTFAGARNLTRPRFGLTVRFSWPWLRLKRSWPWSKSHPAGWAQARDLGPCFRHRHDPFVLLPHTCLPLEGRLPWTHRTRLQQLLLLLLTNNVSNKSGNLLSLKS